MIAGVKPYPEMKASGVDWLGEVPEHWEVLPNRAVYEEVKERDRPEETMLSVTITQGVIHQQTLLSGSSKKDSSNPNKAAYKLVRPGEIVYNKMRAWQGAVGVSDYRGIVSPAYVVQRPCAKMIPRYVHHLLRTLGFAGEAERWSYGITSDMWSLRPEDFKQICGCVPPIEEQTAIVRFLDHADRRIRCYIRAKERLIELLEEQKQAIVHQAVTGQIDVRTGQPYPAYKNIAMLRNTSNSSLPLPPLAEQTAIVRFLDHGDRRIRRYIRAKERLIELLEEQKQARIIHQAVTGQIDVRTGQPYPAYKDSGVEWLGEVPEHWEVRRLKLR